MRVYITLDMLKQRHHPDQNLSHHCLIARALTAWLPLPPGYWWEISWYYAIIRDEQGTVERIELPKAAKKLVYAYDDHRRIKPTSFQI